jgi:hypothetical protein
MPWQRWRFSGISAASQRRLGSKQPHDGKRWQRQSAAAVTGGGFDGTVTIDGVDAVEGVGGRYQCSQNGAAAGR